MSQDASRVSVHEFVGGTGREQEGFCTCTPPAKNSVVRPPCAGIVSCQPHQILFVVVRRDKIATGNPAHGRPQPWMGALVPASPAFRVWHHGVTRFESAPSGPSPWAVVLGLAGRMADLRRPSNSLITES